MMKLWFKRHLITACVATFLLGELAWTILYNAFLAWQNAPSFSFDDDGWRALPEMTFGWIQAAINLNFLIFLFFGLAKIKRIQLSRDVWRSHAWSWHDFCGVMIVLAFTLPSGWLWLSNLWRTAMGQGVIDFGTWWYVVSALCQLILFMVVLEIIADKLQEKYTFWRQKYQERKRNKAA